MQYRYWTAHSLIASIIASLALSTMSAFAQDSLPDQTNRLLLHGQYDKALEQLVEAREDDADGNTDNDAYYLARALILNEIGRYDDAIAAARNAVDLNPRNTSARRLLGQLYETTGQYDEAIETYAWFDVLLRRSFPFRADVQTDAGIAIQRHAVLTRRRDLTERTRYALQDLFQVAYERVDPDYYPARLAAADLLREKYNLDEAKEDYEAALKIEPDLAHAHVGLGAIALESWDFDTTEAAITKALDINPNSTEAYCLKAQLALTARRFTDAIDAAQQALTINPNDLHAMGLMASAHYRLGHIDVAEDFIAKAQRFNARSPIVPNTVGLWLSAGRQYELAAAYLKQAIQRAPQWSTPLTSLGLMHMQNGLERDARLALETSWELDPFNAKTKHTLDLLDELDRFSQYETSHFVIKSVDQPDAAIREYVAVYLESIYDEMTSQFGGEPQRKTIIEIFPEHSGFAVRITGNPWLHTIGACTGPVIAIDAPRHGRFDWAYVLRHEFAHTVTLTATNYNIPHWFTEGLAVYAEDSPKTFPIQRMLSEAYRTNTLFDMDHINWGFFKPKRFIDRQLAYAQSEWLVEYIFETYGNDTIGQLLKAFADEPKQDAVFERVLDITPGAFYQEFKHWAAKRITSWNLSTSPIQTVDELQTLIDATDDDTKAVLLAELAERQLFEGDEEKANDAITEAFDLNPDNAAVLTMLLRVAQVYHPEARTAEDRKSAAHALKPYAEQLRKLDADNLDALVLLGRIAFDKKDFDAATDTMSHLRRIYPDHPLPYQLLSAIYLDEGDVDAALPLMLKHATFEKHNVELTSKIADIYAEKDDIENAIIWLRRTIYINPYDIETHKALSQHLIADDRTAEAVEEYKLLVLLEPGVAAHHSRLAHAWQTLGQVAKARVSAQRAVTLDPDSDAAELLDSP